MSKYLEAAEFIGEGGHEDPEEVSGSWRGPPRAEAEDEDEDCDDLEDEDLEDDDLEDEDLEDDEPDDDLDDEDPDEDDGIDAIDALGLAFTDDDPQPGEAADLTGDEGDLD